MFTTGVNSRSLLPCHLSETSCGTWQAEYSKLHRAVSTGVAPSRRLISVPVASGFADRITSSMTAMLFALLSDRAIHFETQPVNSEQNLRPLTDVFSMDTIDWSVESPKHVVSFLDSISPTIGDADETRQHSFGQVPGDNSSYYISMVNGWGSENLFTTVFEESSEYSTVYLVLNHGMTISAYSDPFVKQQLQELGLSERTTFGCLYKYLFQPNAQIFGRFPVELSSLSDQFALKIGIQLQTGHLAQMVNAKTRTDLDAFQPFFDCAQQIEDTRRQLGQRVVWYFVSDSIGLCGAVAAKYGVKVLVKTSGVNTQLSADGPTDQDSGVVSTSMFESRAGEHFFLGMTDYQVVSSNSVTGRSAAFLRQSEADTVYTMDPVWGTDQAAMTQTRQCGVHDVDSYRDVAAHRPTI